MSLSYTEALEHVELTKTLVEGACRSWCKGDIYKLAAGLKKIVQGSLESEHECDFPIRCLLVCDGESADTAIYLSCVIAGISVIPYSSTQFRKDPHRPFDELRPTLVVAPRRHHHLIRGDQTFTLWTQEDITTELMDDLAIDFQSVESWRFHEDDEAYVISTSGSTGAPKYVPITHRNIRAWQVNSLPVLNLSSHSRFGGTYPLFFDAAAMFIFGCLSTGCSIHLPEKHDAMKPVTFAKLNNLTHWATVPSALLLSNRTEPEVEPCESIEVLGLGGEVVRPLTAYRFAEFFPNTEVVNLYGPAEATIFVATSRMTVREIASIFHLPSLPLDQPSADWELVGESGEVGDVGELVISGPQVFNGYIRMNLSHKDAIQKDRLSTGDLFKFIDGQLHYLGRTDNQVKIRGQRITLEALESEISRVPGVTAVCCFPSDSTEMDIDVVYTGVETSVLSMVLSLGGLVPFGVKIGKTMKVDSLPVTPNGKVDRFKILGLFEGQSVD